MLHKRHLFIFIVALFLLSASSVWAKGAKGPDYRVGADEVITSDVYRAAESVSVAGVIQGDLIVAAQNIEVTGTVEGDVIAAGQTIQISGDVKGNVRVAGQNIILIGETGKNVTAFGQNITIDGTVGWGVVAYGQSIRLDGAIAKDVDTGGESVAIEGVIGGNLTVRDDETTNRQDGSDTRIFDTATVGGDLLYYGAKPTIDNETSIAGVITFKGSPIDQATRVGIGVAALTFVVVMKVMSILGMIVVGLLLVRFLRSDVLTVVQEVIAHPTINFFWGIIVLIVTPVALVILGLTLIGLPLALFGGVMYAVLLYVAKVFIGITAGVKIVEGLSKTKAEGNRLYWAVALGLLVMNVLLLIPFIGAFIWFLCLLEVLGALSVVIKKRLARNKF